MWEAQSFSASIFRAVEEEEKAGLRASFDHGQVLTELAPARRRPRRRECHSGAAPQQQVQPPQEGQRQVQQEWPQPQQQQQQQQQQQEQQQQQQIPVPTMDLTAIPGVVLANVFGFVSFREQGRCLRTAPAVRDAIVASGPFKNIVIPDNSRRAGPAAVAALVRLSMGTEATARRLEIGLNAGRFPYAVMDLTNYAAVLANEPLGL